MFLQGHEFFKKNMKKAENLDGRIKILLNNEPIVLVRSFSGALRRSLFFRFVRLSVIRGSMMILSSSVDDDDDEQ